MSPGGPISIVHPRLFTNAIRDLANPPVRDSFALLTKAVLKSVKRRAGLAG
jgi:hypothetical protein